MNRYVSVQKLQGGFLFDSDANEDGPVIMTSLQKVMQAVRAALTEDTVEGATND